MGEVLVSSEGGGGTTETVIGPADTPELMIRNEDRTNDGGGDSVATTTTNNVVRWEKFFPKMIVRVLLAEADDSTRQIITALLRKCSYKVAAVSDGLKAWEVLKGRSHNIDLILTEVDLPSISGFALLSLIMEHQVCKNIPVIMMSAHDSVSTVYKCMLRGAADFLVKPVRKNELKNLWQHVWRRQASTTGGNWPQEEQKEEATAENNATSNRSSGYMACIQQNRECIEKGSDEQSSCAKPDFEANLATEANTCREAIDLIGSFESYPNPSYKKVDHPSPILDLSLRRSHPSSSVNQFGDDRHRLKQSDASAFSRYVNRTQPPLTASISNQQSSKNPVDYNSDTRSAPVASQIQFPSLKQRVFPVPVPVSGSSFENPYGSALPPPFCVQPGLSHVQSPCSSGHQEPSFFQGNPYHISAPEARNDPHKKPTDETETPEDRGHLSSPIDHSASSSFCNGGTLNRLNSIGSGNNGDANTHRSIQREAALNKFRMKRKDRCFDKKVRYESRKKLAEQRPRVKGQFVRQGQTAK